MDENPYKAPLTVTGGPKRAKARWRKWLPAAAIVASLAGLAVGAYLFLAAYAAGYNRMEGEFVSTEQRRIETVALFGGLGLMAVSLLVGVPALSVLMVRAVFRADRTESHGPDN